MKNKVIKVILDYYDIVHISEIRMKESNAHYYKKWLYEMYLVHKLAQSNEKHIELIMDVGSQEYDIHMKYNDLQPEKRKLIIEEVKS